MTSPDRVPVALIQSRCSEDVAHNVTQAQAAVRQAAEQGAQIVCLQELFATPYFCQEEDHQRFTLAESLSGPSSAWMSSLARDLGIVLVGGSCFEKRAAGIYHNTSLVFDADGTQLGLYRKMHIPDDPFFYEKFYFTPGDLGFLSFDTTYGRVGVCICWDQWFPEAARLTALAGAELIFFPTAIGWIPGDKSDYGQTQVESWVTVMRSHAITNGCYVAAVNRVGIEENIEFWGHSFATNPYGEVLGAANQIGAEILFFEFDRQLCETARTHWPFLRDRRCDAYGGLSKRWGDS